MQGIKHCTGIQPGTLMESILSLERKTEIKQVNFQYKIRYRTSKERTSKATSTDRDGAQEFLCQVN